MNTEINSTKLKRLLNERWGFGDFRTGQLDGALNVLSGSDTILLLPTGGGKSLVYSLPAELFRQEGKGPTLVISPLIALMNDQVKVLNAKGVRAIALHSAMTATERKEAMAEGVEATLIYVSPERLKRKGFQAWLKRQKIAAVVVDEAHCISEWGHDFRPAYRQIGEVISGFEVPILAATATATRRVVDEISSSLAMRSPKIIRAPVARPNLSFSVEHCATGRPKRVAELIQTAEMEDGRCIIYMSSRKRAATLAKSLRRRGIKAGHYHAGRTVGARDNALRAFEEGRRPVLVATSAFGMGVDRPDVRLVIHAMAPLSLEAYYQEAGRAGRDGKPASVVLLYSPSDAIVAQKLMGATPHPGAESGWSSLLGYVWSTRCRTRLFVEHFTGDEGKPCGACDCCLNEGAVSAGLEAAKGRGRARAARRTVDRQRADDYQFTADQLRSVVDFVGSMKRPLGKRLVAQGLRGSRAKAAMRKGLASNPHYGVLKGVPERSIVRAVVDLLGADRLAPRGKKYPTVWLPDKRVRPKQKRARKKPTVSNLLSALKRMRTKEARRLRWKPYQVFNNATLTAIADQKPKDNDELLAIRGVGPAKISRFGVLILELVEADGAR